MSLKSTVLFETPQGEIASLINTRITTAEAVFIISGFVTVEGIKALEGSISVKPEVLKLLIVGSGTYKAYEALDELIALGIKNENLFVHLGHSHLTGPNAKHRFYRYHPMLHSKIYYLENANGNACAIIGSHNMTGFALMGLNGEAAVMLEGEYDDPEFRKIRQHIEQAKRDAVVYIPGMKQAFAWWAHELLDGFVQKASDYPRELENKRTLLIFTGSNEYSPKKDQVLYFEIPAAVGRIVSTSDEVHIFIFDSLLNSPFECLNNLQRAAASFFCKIEGIENDNGGKELETDWFIDNEFWPLLKEAVSPFRPLPKSEKQQIRVRLLNSVFNLFKYFFGKHNEKWIPVLDEQRKVSYNQNFAVMVEKYFEKQPETKEWKLVTKLIPAEEKEIKPNSQYEVALKSMQPESGAFILFSTARKKIEK